MGRLEISSDGIHYTETSNTPFGEAEAKVSKTFSDWRREGHIIEFVLTDIAIEMNREGCISRAIFEVSNFRDVGKKSKLKLTSPKRNNKGRGVGGTASIFIERAEQQLKNKQGQAFKILRAINDKPGLDKDSVCVAIRVSETSGSVAQFLVALESLNLIYSDKKSGRKRYFPR